MAEMTATPNRWLITITVMLVAVIEVLDMTIVNVAMPNMMGALSADTDQITWVLTSYIVAAAIFMPLTGFFVNRWGCKRLLLVNIIGFTLASMLCGMATSLGQMVTFRVLQGIFGAALVPLSQFILRTVFSKEEQGMAMSVWGIGIMTGPVLGPTLGGYITEALNWRWVFYINIPICILAFFMAYRLIEETPLKPQKIDWLGMILMIVGIGCLQIFLDRGNQEDWFNSSNMICLASTAVFALSYFCIRGWHKTDNIINLHLFKDRNFCTATCLLSVFCMAAFSLIAVNPLMLEHLMGYPVMTAGEAMAPRGISSALSMAFVARLMRQYDPRIVISIGLGLCAFGSYLMSQFNLTMTFHEFMVASSFQGFGMGLVFPPLSALALSTLPKHTVAEASGLFSFGRSIGNSIGISILITLITRGNQSYWHQLGRHINPYNPQLTVWLNAHHLNLANPLTALQLAKLVSGQASMMSFDNGYYLVFLFFIIIIPFVWILKRPEQRLATVHLE